MKRISRPEWTPYSCQLPTNENRYSASACTELSEVRHVAHFDEAKRILQDGRIKAGLVYDESLLRHARITVAWLSANTWSYGSIYGTTEFTFDWARIVEDRRVYWVEAVPHYKPPAYRFLLTERDLPDSEFFQRYDPCKDDGPLKRRTSGEWYWNGNYTSEFMIDTDLSLDACTGIRFVLHHPRICANRSNRCSEMTSHPQEISSRILAFILGNGIHFADEMFRPSKSDWKRHQIDFSRDDISRDLRDLSRGVRGSLTRPSSRRSVLRGALALYGSNQNKAAERLVALLASKKEFDTTFEDIITRHFDRRPGRTT